MSETPLLNKIRLAATKVGARLFRNNVGIATHLDGSKVRYGLRTGSADLIGWTPVRITQKMVGETVAVFTSIEAKSKIGSLDKDQERWMLAVLKAGGIAGEVKSAKEAVNVLTSCWHKRK